MPNQFVKLYSSYWTDADMEDWLPEMKYFYIYCITNDRINASGCYQFSVRKAGFELGWSKETVENALNILEEAGKLKRDSDTKEIYLTAYHKYNSFTANINLQKHLSKHVSNIKSAELLSLVLVDIEAYSEDEINVDLPDAPNKKAKTTKVEINIPFKDLWEVWERPYDSSMSKAEKEWVKLNDDQRTEAWKFIPQFMNDREPKFRPYLFRLLRDRMWEAAKPAIKTDSPKQTKLTVETTKSFFE